MGVSQVGLLVTVPVLVSSPKELWLNRPLSPGKRFMCREALGLCSAGHLQATQL